VTEPNPLALEFIRFCIARKGTKWPDLYDEMCRVASRRLFNNLGYSELSELGLSFALSGLGTTRELVDRLSHPSDSSS